MKVLVNGFEVYFDDVEAIASTDEITRQFTLIDIAEKQNYFKGDVVEIYDDNDRLFIKADIEYIEAVGSSEKNEFIYAGRNKAKYIVDCYADKTTQFSSSQNINTVFNNIASPFGIKVEGDAKLPKQEVKTILIGEKISKAFLEIAQSAGKIITSTAKGDLKIEFQAQKMGETVLEYGTNIITRHFIDDSTEMYDKHTIVSQSSYLAEQTQDVFVKGAFGSGLFHKVVISKNTLTAKECEDIAEIEYKKNIRKSIVYVATIDDVDVDLNTQYLLKDDAVRINEKMNCKAIKLVQNDKENYTLAFFEKVVA